MTANRLPTDVQFPEQLLVPVLFFLQRGDFLRQFRFAVGRMARFGGIVAV